MSQRKKVSITRKIKNKSVDDIGRRPNKYTKYYPSLLDPYYNEKITHHPIFKRYKLRRNTKKIDALYKAFETNIPMIDKKKLGKVRILKPTQKLLRNFMSSYSPNRGLLIYHEMGVGKTCTAITIAEELKKIVQDSNKKIYVLRYEEIERQIFDINAIERGEPLNQCTGNTYLQDNEIISGPGSLSTLTDGCMGSNKDMCAQLKSKVDKTIRKTYKFMGAQSWARDVQKTVDSKTRNIADPTEKAARKREIISDMFNNAVIIVDEAHELRYSTSKNPTAKIVPPVLEMVLRNTSNLRLILLTATPIYDEPQNIIMLLNYFLINDKREPIKENDVFDQNGNLKPNGSEILKTHSRGYVSFLRGSNPYDFPVRISARYNIPDRMLNLNKYPRKDIYGRKLSDDERIKYFDLVDCPLEDPQKEVLLYHVKNNEVPDINEYNIDEYTEIDVEFEYPPSDVDDPGNIKTLDKMLTADDKSKSHDTLLNNFDRNNKHNKHNKNNKNNKNNIGEQGSISESSKKSKPESSIDSLQKKLDLDVITEHSFAYQKEVQISNFVYQDLKECNNNITLSYGKLGLSQVTTKVPSKRTFKFNDPNYANRFKLDELRKWGIKIAMAVESAIKSNGPVFIYTLFTSAGIIPLAFALEMNGFRRYKQWGAPLLESNFKDSTYRGDYIIYSGDVGLSTYAKEYLDMGQNMIREKSVKVFIGSEKASEGLNLFGYREVHIIEPWHNINKTEQSIGRVIRTGSHLHLPPQERNVTVYQYATTLDDRESIDLKVYRISEGKAIKAGKVEKILKENAFDCSLNEAENIYDDEYFGRKVPVTTSLGNKIMISLSDQPYSRGCFYMGDCEFTCVGNKKSRTRKQSGHVGKDIKREDLPLMKFNYEKEAEEYRNLIIELMKTTNNVKIENLRRYLKKYIYDLDDDDLDRKKNIDPDILDIVDDEETFNLAIQDIINMDIVVKDKLGRVGKIVVSGEYLRFIPDGNLEPNMSIQRQYMKPVDLIKQVDLKSYITTLKDYQKRISDEEKFNYSDILNKYLIEKSEQIFYGTIAREFKYNVKVKIEEIISVVFDKLLYGYKLIILKTLLDKIIKSVKLNESEKRVEHAIQQNIVYFQDIFPERKRDADTRKNIYGFVIQNSARLELYSALPEGGFENDSGNVNKYKEYRKAVLSKTPMNKLHGYLKYEKSNSEPIFKITDIAIKGEKKSVTGIICTLKGAKYIISKIKSLDSRVVRGEGFQYTKTILCNDVEALLRRNDMIKLNGRKWYYSPEDYGIYFGGN
jgi:hypothetical protein